MNRYPSRFEICIDGATLAWATTREEAERLLREEEEAHPNWNIVILDHEGYGEILRRARGEPED